MTSYCELKHCNKVMNLDELENGKVKTLMPETVISKKEREERAYKHLTLIRLRSMYNNSRREADEGTEFSINPDPVPYQPNNFIAGRSSRLDGAESTVPPSSTMMKKVPVARRHFDTFGTIDWMSGIPKRGMMLHTDRYNWDLAKALDGMSQRGG
ncbi:uncharacterized protein LOC132724488 [Ruditapes philippinarum]|uniref:uncharacterized protein LOC132724488 n=1 Tax=Ruditapes philippinarum TaxID=129788 RepID=UPI00295A6404|nr:uncharacterized protein LOC132724488 [Ruditapes philippinarum]